MRTSAWWLGGLALLLTVAVLAHLWRGAGSLRRKCLLSMVALVPFLGPMLYVLLWDIPDAPGGSNTPPAADGSELV